MKTRTKVIIICSISLFFAIVELVFDSDFVSRKKIIGDINSDGIVDSVDHNIVADNFGKRCPPEIKNCASDLNKDGTTDMIDLGIIISHMNEK